MAIVQTLDVSNVKKIVAAHIDTRGSHVFVSGENGSGKTSLIDALWAAVGGVKFDQPLRLGQESGKVVADCGDFTVTRWFSPSGTRLEVRTKDGDVKAKPQEFLDKVMGEIGFDPMAFERADTKVRAKILARLGGVDIDALSEVRKSKYNERTAIGRVRDEAKAKVDQCQVRVETARVDVSALTDELRQVNARNAKRQELRNAAYVKDSVVTEYEALIEDLSKKLAEAQDSRDLAQAAAAKAKEEAKAAGEDESVTGIEDKIKSASVVNQNADQYLRFVEANKEYEARKAQNDRFTADIKAIDDQIAKAMPEDLGVSVTPDGIAVNGILFENLSSAERIVASAKIGMKLGGELKIMRVSDGSLLDQKSKEALIALADESGYQLWVERVGKEKGSVVVEDGQVVSYPQE